MMNTMFEDEGQAMASCDCEGRTVDAENYNPVRLAYNSFDPKNGADVEKPPIIFLHGLTSSKEAWGDVPQSIANESKRKAYAFDFRNHGDSEWSDVHHLGVLVLDLFHFMDTVVHAEEAILVGHSLGATIAINAALMKENRVELLVVEDMCVKLKNSQLRIKEKILAYLRLAPEAVQLVPQGTDEKTAAQIIMQYYWSKVRPGKSDDQKLQNIDPVSLGLRQRPDGRYELKANMAVLERSLSGKIYTMLVPHGSYGGPTCFVYGEMSEIQVPTDAENIYKHFPQVEIVRIDNASHFVHKDCPKQFTKEVVRFLSTHSHKNSIEK